MRASWEIRFKRAGNIACLYWWAWQEVLLHQLRFYLVHVSFKYIKGCFKILYSSIKLGRETVVSIEGITGGEAPNHVTG